MTIIDELKLWFDIEVNKQKIEWINHLKETKKRADEIYKNEVWYSLYYYVNNKS